MSNTNKIYKCPLCPYKVKKVAWLYKHVEELHGDEIPPDNTVKQFIFNKKYNKTKGSCVIDKLETAWNETLGRYERYCSERCRKIAGERAKENMRKKYGKAHLLDDPEYQEMLQEKRKLHGEYKFKDGGIISYFGSYEKDFLEFCDKKMKMKSHSIQSGWDSKIILYYYFGEDVNGKPKRRFYIPDYYIQQHNLLIEIKDSGFNHSGMEKDSRQKEKLKDKAIIDSKAYNYIKIRGKEYFHFIELIETLAAKPHNVHKNSDEPIIIID